MRKQLLTAIMAGLALACPVHADSGSGGSTISKYFTPEQAADFSKRVEYTLARKGARLAIVFRTGRTRDKLPDGIRYTHGSFWVHQDIEAADGSRLKGYVSYNLFHGDGEKLPRTQSYLATDFPYEFMEFSAVEDVAIIIPHPELQLRILAMMGDGRYEALHDTDYSLISNPFDDQYQNCNEFMLDVIAAALWDTTDYSQIKSNLRQHFLATRVRTGPLARMFGPFVDNRLKLSDHRGGPIETVTFASLGQFMLENGYASESLLLTPDSPLLAGS